MAAITSAAPPPYVYREIDRFRYLAVISIKLIRILSAIKMMCNIPHGCIMIISHKCPCAGSLITDFERTPAKL